MIDEEATKRKTSSANSQCQTDNSYKPVGSVPRNDQADALTNKPWKRKDEYYC